MPHAGVSARARRRDAAPWWEDLDWEPDREAFRFPTTYEVKPESPKPVQPKPVQAPVARPTLRRHERPGFRPDRAALWAVMLGLLLILVAATSAHAAILH